MAGRHALLIATETYADPALRRLTAPGGDARALEEVLSDPSIAGFEVTTLIDQPHHVVGEAIGEFYRVRRRDELTLLYFTGHGVKDDDGSLYLAMANTRRDSLMFTALAAELVDRALAGCPSRQKVLVLDCCYSGAFPAGKLAKAATDVHTLERFQGRGRAVLTASDATQYSFEGDAVVGSAARSLFTRHLVAGLRDGSADLDGDGDVTVDELYSYVHERVVAEMPRQRPKHQSDVEGRIVLARNPRWTLPEYLRHGLASPIATDRLSALEGLKRLNRVGNAVVRERTAGEIRKLVDDDSRMVSGAAAAWMTEAEGPAAAAVPEPHIPELEPRAAAEPVVVESERRAAAEPVPVVAEPEPQVTAEPVADALAAGTVAPAAAMKPGAARQEVPEAAPRERPGAVSADGHPAVPPLRQKPAVVPRPVRATDPPPADRPRAGSAARRPAAPPPRVVPAPKAARAPEPQPVEDSLDPDAARRSARFYFGTAGLTLVLLIVLMTVHVGWPVLVLAVVFATMLGLGVFSRFRHSK
ncbi:caspase family protein [Amycolatopsis sp. NPDC051758]|uniref:caspase, EACC1-associated type n=1 Tax=Amycolatopsis sp. NPDC051758 TaxID=3363935 RepID=UPI0037BD28B0